MARTKGWLERTIINSLWTEDGRYKHGVASKLVSTPELVEYHEGITGSEETTAKASVNRTLSSLQEKGLVKKHLKANSNSNGGPAVWMITEEGIEESFELRSMFQEKVQELNEKFGLEYDVCATTGIKVSLDDSTDPDE